MKITLGTKDLEKIVKDYAYTNYPGKDIQVAITNKRNGVEVVIDLEEPEVNKTEDVCAADFELAQKKKLAEILMTIKKKVLTIKQNFIEI